MQTNDTVLCSKWKYRTHSKTTRPDTTNSLLDTFGWFTLWWTNIAGCIILPAIYIYLFVWRVSHSLGLKGVHVLNSLSGMCVPVNLFEYQKNETTESNMTSIKVFLSYPSNPKKVQELHGTITFSVYHFSSPQLKKQSKVSSFVVAPEVQVAKSLQYSNQWTLNVVEPGSIPEWRPPLQRRLPRPTGHTDLVSHRRTKGEYPAGRDFWNLKHIHLDSKIPCRDTYLKTGSFITYTCCGMETGESF